MTTKQMLCPEGHEIKEVCYIHDHAPLRKDIFDRRYPGNDITEEEFYKAQADSSRVYKCLVCEADGNEIGFKWFKKDQCKEVEGE